MNQFRSQEINLYTSTRQPKKAFQWLCSHTKYKYGKDGPRGRSIRHCGYPSHRNIMMLLRVYYLLHNHPDIRVLGYLKRFRSERQYLGCMV